MKRLLLGTAIAALASGAWAADLAMPKKAPTGYAYGQCGYYYGLNTMGVAGLINGGPPGNSIIQGDLGVTLGYGCPGSGTGTFWFAEGNFDWANINGSANGLGLTGPAHFEQRAGFGGPLSSLLNVFPGLSNGLAVSALPAFQNGVTSGPQFPFLFISLHEQDISGQVGLASNREWLISPGVGIGLESRLSNGVVADVTAQWKMDSQGLAIGSQSIKLENAAVVGLTLKY